LKYLRRIDLLKIFARCFLIQGSWNYQSLLGLGFCYAAIPILKRLKDSDEEKARFIQRHIQFFNSHPYFAGYCLGAVAKLEESVKQKEWVDDRSIALFKERLVGPLGAIGDRLFWANIKPAAAGFAVFLGMLVGWLAIPVFLVVYNVPHIYLRAKGLFLGYKKGFDIVSDISERKFSKLFNLTYAAGAIATGLCLGLALFSQFQKGHLYLEVFIISAVIAFVANVLKKSINLALVIASVFSVFLGFLLLQ
jgi:mannose/fructose/N-acetylgalactosamine-specific phosphotransferase system component IID